MLPLTNSRPGKVTLDINSADLLVKLPYLEVSEQASVDKSKQQPGLCRGLSGPPGRAFACLCFAVAPHLKACLPFDPA